jgi:exodeoxyribonuclease III
MTYNIRTGGAGRLDAITAVIREQRPDVLALQELRGFGRRGDPRLEALAGALDMRPVLAGSWFGQPVAVLVRAGARVLAAGPLRGPLHHGAARLVVDTDHGPLTVIGTHLYPHRGWRRLLEARWLAWRARPRGLVLLMGDLNSLDPWTGHAQRVARLDPQHRARHLRAGSTVDTRAVAHLAAAGFVDLFRVAGSGPGHTVPTAYGGAEFGGAEFGASRPAGERRGTGHTVTGGLRLDYLLASPALARLACTCQVVTGGAAEVASDHYPLLARLDLDLV